MSDMTQAGREARKWLASASRASGDSLSTAEAGTVDALLGIGNALLDLTAAVREQTKAFQDDGIRALTERNA
jgi:hypothetical protein